MRHENHREHIEKYKEAYQTCECMNKRENDSEFLQCDLNEFYFL